MVMFSGEGASSVLSYCGVASRELSEEEASVSGEAEDSSSVYSSEVVSAFFMFCSSSLCLFTGVRVEAISGVLVDVTSPRRVHGTADLGISLLLSREIGLMLVDTWSSLRRPQMLPVKPPID